MTTTPFFEADDSSAAGAAPIDRGQATPTASTWRSPASPFSHKQRVARLRGEAAFLNGKALSDNPYSMEKLRHAWHDAYVAARRKAATEAEACRG